MSSPDPQDPRQAILRAAVEVLHRYGHGGLTVRAVGAKAGCSTKGVYTWFGSKNGLIDAILVDGFRRFSAAQQRVVEAVGNDLAALADSYRDWALANPTHYRVMFQGAVPGYEPSDTARDIARSAFDQLIDAIESANPVRVASSSATDLAYHLWATVHGYVSLEISGMTSFDDETNARLFRDGMRLARGKPTAPQGG